MTLAFAARLRPCRPRAAEIARSKKGKNFPREARAENMVGWKLLTIPVSFSKASLKNWNLLIIPVSFF